jgi:hypothetical protein
MIVDYTGTSPLTTLANQIKAGAIDQSSIGPGNIISSAASGGAHPTGLGYADASTIGATTFAGKAVDSTAALIRYTYLGDANVDGKVSGVDFNALAINFGGTSKIWSQADFNYDGIVNTVDFNALAQNFNFVANTPAPPAFGSLVPEPSVLVLAGLGFATEWRRRRTHRARAV